MTSALSFLWYIAIITAFISVLAWIVAQGAE
jgi:hypothetical protein